jgi:O-antigen ligase
MKYRLPSLSSLSNAVKEGRGMLVLCGWEMFKQSYGFGIGAGGFEEAIIHQPLFNGTFVNPHNLFVEIFAQYGVFIVAFFCLWLFSIFYFTLKNKQLSVGARMAVCVTVITLPFIGIMSSQALGYTYNWIFLSCATVISTYKFSLNNKTKEL